MSDSDEDLAALDTICAQEYLMFVRDIGLFDFKRNSAPELSGLMKNSNQSHNHSNSSNAGPSLPAYMTRGFTLGQIFMTFTAPNIDSDWQNEDTSCYSLDTEMVEMEFEEGIARLAYLGLQRSLSSGKDQSEVILSEEQFGEDLERLLVHVYHRFPAKSKYQRVISGETTTMPNVMETDVAAR